MSHQSNIRLLEAPPPDPPQSPRQTPSPAVVLAVTGLAAVFTVALTFATIELPNWLTRWADRWIDIPDYHPAMEPEVIEEFLASSYVRPVGYACLALVLLLIVAGLVTKRVRLSAAGAVLLFLPTFGFFAGYMFFLAGLGVLRAVWLPAWGGWMALGDVAYAPYMAIAWPLWQLGLDVRHEIAYTAIALGLFVFVLSTAAWLMSRATGRRVADFWLYRYSRHPQYLGWILWSWGLMLLAGLEPVPFGGENPGAALPWVITTMVIIGVAWAEEGRMVLDESSGYAAYRARTPFLFPVPRMIGRILTAPLTVLMSKRAPETRAETAAAVVIYLGLILLLSLPFVLLEWPPLDWWGWPT